MTGGGGSKSSSFRWKWKGFFFFPFFFFLLLFHTYGIAFRLTFSLRVGFRVESGVAANCLDVLSVMEGFERDEAYWAITECLYLD